MRTPALIVALAALTASNLLAQVIAADTATKPPDGLVVHEWGTFTSYSGPSGEITPFNVRIGEHLPKFVLARNYGKGGWASAPTSDFTKESFLADQRMETPVIYFHSDAGMEVSVNVSMPHGLATEVYPPVTGTTPEFLESTKVPAGGSSIRWANIKLTPKYCCDTMTFPDAGDSHYAFARATSANVISVGSADKPSGERFLFYRGILSGTLGVKARPLGNDRFVISESVTGPLATVFAIEVTEKQVRFVEAHDLKPGVELVLPASPGTQESLEAAMAASLEKAGLFNDEALAMVNTWKHLWFGESGTRMMVILPQSTIDEALRLTVTPTPTEVKRVFVSRLEMLTPEKQQWIQGLIARQTSAAHDEKEVIAKELSKLGRWDTPAIKIAREDLSARASASKAVSAHH